MNKSNLFFLFCSVFLLFAWVYYSGGEPTGCTSPDGRNAIKLELNDKGELTYTIERDGKTIIAASRLGLEVKELNLNSGFEIVDVEATEKN